MAGLPPRLFLLHNPVSLSDPVDAVACSCGSVVQVSLPRFIPPIQCTDWLSLLELQFVHCPAGITAKIQPTEQGVDVQLVSDGSGAGRGGGEKKDVLPPLMPGLKARQQ
jgi:hypothetical protein